MIHCILTCWSCWSTGWSDLSAKQIDLTMTSFLQGLEFQVLESWNSKTCFNNGLLTKHYFFEAGTISLKQISHSVLLHSVIWHACKIRSLGQNMQQQHCSTTGTQPCKNMEYHSELAALILFSPSLDLHAESLQTSVLWLQYVWSFDFAPCESWAAPASTLACNAQWNGNHSWRTDISIAVPCDNPFTTKPGSCKNDFDSLGTWRPALKVKPQQWKLWCSECHNCLHFRIKSSTAMWQHTCLLLWTQVLSGSYHQQNHWDTPAVSFLRRPIRPQSFSQQAFKAF